jgi:DNA-binding LacI/PurR family transcriptional regulator
MAITLKDVATMAGVHPSTVSRVLRGKESLPISEDTRLKILQAAKSLQYRPDQRARALRLGKTQTIGLIIPDISNLFFAEIANTIEHHCYNSGYTLMVCATNEEQEKEIRFINDLVSRGVDGLIIASVQDSDKPIRELLDKKIPFVLIDREFEDLPTNAVISNNEEAAYHAVEFLAKQGHKRIGFLRSRKNIYTIRKRLTGYLKGLRDFGLEEDPALIAGDGYSFERGYHGSIELLALNPPPTAILVSGNRITFGAIKAIVESGKHIPEDVSLIGFSDTPLAPFLISSLTTISHPLEEMGERAFELLIENMEANETCQLQRVIVETTFNIRASTQTLCSVQK